jgi:hypothetical protein
MSAKSGLVVLVPLVAETLPIYLHCKLFGIDNMKGIDLPHDEH